jgi:hypothetical protein
MVLVSLLRNDHGEAESLSRYSYSLCYYIVAGMTFYVVGLHKRGVQLSEEECLSKKTGRPQRPPPSALVPRQCQFGTLLIPRSGENLPLPFHYCYIEG